MEKKVKGIRCKFIDGVLMVICALITIFILETTIQIKRKYEHLIFLINDYTECNSVINDLKKSSEKLTYYSICFLQRSDPKYLERYFYELNEMKDREKAVDVVSKSHKGDVADINTQLAFQESSMLAKIEIYAMSLMCDALEYDFDTLPPEIQSMELHEDHKTLGVQDKKDYAQHLIFSDKYLKAKDSMGLAIDIALASLINVYLGEEVKSDGYITRQITTQKILIFVLIIFFIALYVTLVVLVFVPLRKHLNAIKKGAKMENIGSYEVRYVAQAYNKLRDKTALDASILKHKAEHDPLTDLINRTAFDGIISLLSESKEPVAYLIIDVDLFKGINDKYGHIVGDKVLVKIARILVDQFRVTDYVGRIGGDEFAIIMTKFGSSLNEIIRMKIATINNILQSSEDGLPPVSLSVGVAMSEEGFSNELIEKADKALYRVKQGGRCNCFFYENKDNYSNMK